MKMKKIFAVIAMVGLLAAICITSAFANSPGVIFFESRGNDTSDLVEIPVTNRKCTLSDGELSVEIDKHTQSHYIEYKMDYYTPGFLGIYGHCGTNVVFSGYLENNTSRKKTEYLTFSHGSFIDDSYSSGDRAHITTFATGATQQYYFIFDNVEFTYSN